jgi:phosphoserine phosphatase
MRLALFDLDNTLLAGDSDYEWGQFLVDRGILERETYEAQNRPTTSSTSPARSTSTSTSASRCARSPRTRRRPRRWHADFMRSRILPMVSAGARALVTRHSSAASSAPSSPPPTASSPRPSRASSGAAPHRDRAGVPRRSLYRAGRRRPLLPRGQGPRLEDWLGSQGRRLDEFSESAFYSDSHNDLPLLERVTRPVAVDPDDELAREAARRGWERISLRR